MTYHILVTYIMHTYDTHILVTYIIHTYDTYMHIYRACTICRFRKGWSCLRLGTRHVREHIKRLWNLAIDTPQSRRHDDLQKAQRRSREQLLRHGFKSQHRCTLLDHANRILLHDPNVPIPLFCSVSFVDLLHWELNTCDYCFDAILGVMDKKMKLECDDNASGLPMLRNPDGSSIRHFTQVSNLTYLTTSLRVTLAFVWVHVLGTQAKMLPTSCRKPALVALSCLQTMLLASQGKYAL